MQLNLCGQEPDTALSSALGSVKFYLQQKELEASMAQNKLENKVVKVQEACKRKLTVGCCPSPPPPHPQLPPPVWRPNHVSV